NPDHIELLEEQKRRRKWDGFIVTNPNCTTSVLAISLKPIHDKYKLDSVIASSMQAVSGAGYPGLSFLDI
ncbi:MAG TPA: aspartate-semialdehyde dehydrogenase, partial [Candidatus Bathyarchaeota archaeon]|nr:aspartate-semialdehyde dehydrogenase [Candidatus Bathyarchaeota archaeon]